MVLNLLFSNNKCSCSKSLGKRLKSEIASIGLDLI